MRTYEITPQEGGWRLSVMEDGVEVAGGFAEGDEGYEFLMEQAEAICAIG
jgi:hypothetical protein